MDFRQVLECLALPSFDDVTANVTVKLGPDSSYDCQVPIQYLTPIPGGEGRVLMEVQILRVLGKRRGGQQAQIIIPSTKPRKNEVRWVGYDRLSSMIRTLPQRQET